MGEIALRSLSYLIYATYPALAAYLVWIIARSLWGRRSYVPWVRSLSPGREMVLRVALSSVGALFAIGFTMFVWSANAAPFVRWVPTVGSVGYVIGCVRWRGPVAFALRGVGWTAMVVAVAVPSQATLFLPMVSLLSVSLHRIPSLGRPSSSVRK